MRVKIIENECGTFSVILGNHVFEMSRDADKPNGVNLYSGPVQDMMPLLEAPAYTGDIPQGLMRGIVNRVESLWKEIIDTLAEAVQDTRKARIDLECELSIIRLVESD